MTFYDSEKPVRVDWQNDDHAAVAIVMPMRIENAKPMPGIRASVEMPPKEAIPTKKKKVKA